MIIDAENGAPLHGNTHAAPLIFDVTAQDFEANVMRASMEKPVLVDFWAPWCGPCKQLMPILERAVTAAGGKVSLAKVNLDENPELAQALRVQSVPAVFAFFQGQPVDGFMGAQPESKIQEFITRVITMANNAKPDALDIPKVLGEAANILNQGDAATAYAMYAQVLQQDEINVSAYVGVVRCLIAMGHLEEAQGMVNSAPEAVSKQSAFSEARSALSMALSQPNGDVQALQDRIDADPDDHQAYIDLAQALFAEGARQEACETLLASIERDLEWEDQAARKALLTMFEAMGAADPVTLKARRRLSSILFS